MGTDINDMKKMRYFSCKCHTNHKPQLTIKVWKRLVIESSPNGTENVNALVQHLRPFESTFVL